MNDLYQRILNFTRDGIYRYRFEDGMIFLANQGLVDILEFDGSPDDLVGHQLREVLTYTEREGTVRSQLERHGEIHEFEYHFRTLKGTDKWVLHDSFIVEDPDTGERLVEAVVKDITERKRAEEAISRERARLAVTLQSIGDGVIATDTNGKVTEINGVAETLTGWNHDEAIGQPLEEVFRIVNEKTGAPCVNPVAKVLESGRIVGLANHTTLISRSGVQCSIADSGAPIRAADGEILGVVLVFRDVSEQKRAQMELERLFAAIEQAGEIVIITDAEGTIRYVNPAFAEVTGYARGEAVGKTPAILRSGRQNPEFYRNLWETLRSGQTWKGRFINRKKDGDWYEEDATISPVRDETGAIVNYVAVGRDSTHESELQRQLLHAQKMEAIGRLAGGIAHDFNNLLTVIVNDAAFVREDLEPGSEAETEIDELIDHAKRASILSGQLLAFSRRQVIAARVTDVNEVVLNMETMLRRVIGEDVKLEVQTGHDVAPVRADPSRLEQVIMNLVVNARDAMTGGGVLKIETGRAALDEDARGALVGGEEATARDFSFVSVTDTGHGMDAEMCTRIFEPFFTTKGLGRGTGLGLSTVHGIVRQHQGLIGVESQPGGGSKFTVYFPCEKEKVSPQTESRLVRPRGGGEETILVVEDDASVRNIAVKILRRLGYTVLVAESGRAALDLANDEAQRIDLLFTDVVMPEMDGRALADQVAKLRPNIKVVFASGYPEAYLSEMGVVDEDIRLLRKPFDVREVAQQVREALEGE